jgi:hypothetical protein
MRDPESTNVFRQKITRKGVTIPSRWEQNPGPGKPYEKVYFYGPFATRNVGPEPYVNAGDHTVKIELQVLEAVPPGTLEWVTEKEKVIERDVSELQ